MAEDHKIIVVGGGPAGMMAAIRAAEFCRDVKLVEKNPELGRKLLLSGKGRCNLTNDCEMDYFLGRFSGNSQFLRDAFKKFFNKGLMKFFEDRGLSLRVERQLRVFPVTDRSASILEVLKKELARSKVEVLCNTAVADILVENSGVKGLLLKSNQQMQADRVIVASGGLSYSFTGSTGDGIEIARRLKHRIAPFRPGLVPLSTKQHYPRRLEGLTLKNIRLTFHSGGKKLVSEVGELLWTHNGVSGPLVLSLSGQIADWLRVKDNAGVFMEIDFKPGLTEEQLHGRFVREFASSPKRAIKNTLKELLPKRMIDVFMELARIKGDKKSNQISQLERKTIVLLLKKFRLDISGTSALEVAMITRGGVSLQDINPRTMESRIIKGLYFAGEMIDVDADTGGFNLQAAFSTGYLAGESAASA